MAFSSAPKFTRQTWFSGLTIVLLAFAIVALWQRNRDILRDVFDYSPMIAAAGKVEAGLKPYTDVRAPMQSAVYLLNYGAERIFGRNYLGLTWGGLVLALGGALLIRGLVGRRLGPVAATGVAFAVAAAGPLQHEIFFYNSIGIFCFSAVLLGLAAEPQLRPGRSWRSAAICGALFLGGIDKLNFLGATLVLAGLLSAAAWTSGRITLGAAGRNVLWLALCGCALPLAFELAWTGATFSQWLENVVLLPSARYGYLSLALDWRMYVQPVYDFHHHLLVRGIGGIGLVLLLATGAWLWREAKRNRRPLIDWLARGLLVAVGAVMGALLMVTNHETVVLTSLAYPVLATACYILWCDVGQPAGRWLGWSVGSAILLWAVVGSYAAWHGSRVLYAPNPPARSSYVRLESAAPALAYFNGVRLLPDQIDAWERVAAKLKALEDPADKLPGVIFGPGMEWLERAYPESILRHAPLWYDAGTTLREKDTEYFRGLLGNGERRLIAQRGWQNWTAGIAALFARDYRQESVSARDVLYHPRGARPPGVAPVSDVILPPDAFRDATGGNILVTSTRASEGMMLQSEAFGAARSSNWSWPFGIYDAAGKAVARLQPGVTATGVVTFRAIAGDPENGELLWEVPMSLGPDRREVALPFILQPGGRPVWLQTEVSAAAAGKFFGGWRETRITHTNEQDRSPPPPFGCGLSRIWPVASEPVADQVWFGREGQSLSGEGWAALPAEDWRRDTMQSGKLSVTAEFTPDPANPGDHLVVTLAWYRGSRFEIMTEKEIDPRTTSRLTLEAYVPEPGGWVGVLTRTGRAQHHFRVTDWHR